MDADYDLIEAADENFIGSYRKLVEHSPGGSERDFGGVYAFATGLPISIFNGCPRRAHTLAGRALRDQPSRRRPPWHGELCANALWVSDRARRVALMLVWGAYEINACPGRAQGGPRPPGPRIRRGPGLAQPDRNPVGSAPLPTVQALAP